MIGSDRKVLSNNSEMSTKSLPEIYQPKRLWLKVFFIIILIVNAIIGMVIIINNNYYFNESYQFESMYLLKLFIASYTLIFLTAFFLAVAIILIVYSIYILSRCRLCSKNNPKNNIPESQFSSEDSSFFPNSESRFPLKSYGYAIFLLMLIFLYIIAIPCGIFFISELKSNSVFKDYQRFYLLYLFFLINIIIGIAMLGISCYIAYDIHNKISGKQGGFKLEDEFIENEEKEVKYRKEAGDFEKKLGSSSSEKYLK